MTQNSRSMVASRGWRALALAVGMLTSFACLSDPNPALLIDSNLQERPAADMPASDAGSEPVDAAVALRLSPQLLDSGIGMISPALAEPPPPPPVSPSGRGLWSFAYWFALLLLLSIAARDALRITWQILWQPAPRRAPLPFANWPMICLAFEADDPETLRQTLWRIEELAYPPERLNVIALLDLQSEEMQTVLREARAKLPCEIIPTQKLTCSDGARRCFAAALQSGRGEIVMAIPAGEPLDHQALKRAAEAFLDPTLGALLGYLPLGAPGDQGIAARLSRQMRRASQQMGLSPAQTLPPGTGLVALRRSCAQAADVDPRLPRGTLAILLDVEAAAWRISLQADQIAAGTPMQDWASRARWLRRRAQARVESNAASSLFGLLRHGRFAGEPGPLLTLLWLAVAAAALMRFFAGDGFAAAMGLAVCMACTFGAEARPASLLGISILLRSNGRHASTLLATLAPVVFVHDLQVTLRQTLRSIATRLVRQRGTRTLPDALGEPSTTL